MATNGTQRGMRVGLSLETASAAYDLASWVLVCALIVGAIATIVIVFTGTIKEHHWDIERLASRERIAQLDNETARLHAQNALTSESLLANVHAARSSAITIQTTIMVAERIAVAQGLVDPRSISEAARSVNIISKVAPFAGKKFDAVVTSIDAELGTLRATLATALKNADWIEIKRDDPTAGVGIFSMDRAGGPALVKIDVDASEDPELLDAAVTLASALNAEGIEATVSAKTDPANADVIHILIGPKP